jgi:RNA polymerase sigma factor (sigma-70 family)
MSRRVKSQTFPPRSWTVEELGHFYAQNRSTLLSHANRLLKDSSRSEEVVQDALIRVILAAPEIESPEHAIAYLHKTVENLCIDIFRLENRRPNLVLLDEATAEVDALLSNGAKDHSEQIAAADDAAIIREALSLLSPAERAALVMWEMDGRSAGEIAIELGISEKNVRHTVSRARKSLRRILSEYIIDSERGLTALDMLSTTYKKTAEIAKKSSKAALSLILVFFAFLGFNAMPKDSGVPNIVAEDSVISNSATESAEVIVPEKTKASPAASAIASSVAKANLATVNAKASNFTFAGLDKSGIPTGFTVTDSTGALGSLYVTNRQPVLSETELILSQVAKTDIGAANIFLSQRLISDSSGFSYSPSISYGKAGAWIPLVSSVTFLDSERLLSGNYLVTAIVKVESEVETTVVIPATASGRDLLQAPRQVITRLVLNPGKTQILAQAVYVVEKGVK